MDLLRKLVETPGISGREERLRELILQRTQGLFDETRVDPLGSLHGVRKARGDAATNGGRPKRVMVAAHMDQIGFMVKHIGDDGFLRVQNVGGFDTRNLFARLVTVCGSGGGNGGAESGQSGDLPGVMNPGGRPIHIASEEDKKKIPEVSDLVIDLGMKGDEVKKRVQIGDPVVIHVPFTQVGDTFVGQALDNRVACWIAIRALEKLEHDHTPHACEIHCVFTVQEEVGLRGALTAAYAIEPDIGIGLDTTLCVDTPGTPEDQRVTRQGDGAALTLMDSGSISDPHLIADFERIARDHDIPTQRSILPRGTTDAAAIQRARGGVRSMTLSCPTRYIHTVTEMVHKTDLHACRDGLAAFLAHI